MDDLTKPLPNEANSDSVASSSDVVPSWAALARATTLEDLRATICLQARRALGASGTALFEYAAPLRSVAACGSLEGSARLRTLSRAAQRLPREGGAVLLAVHGSLPPGPSEALYWIVPLPNEGETAGLLLLEVGADWKPSRLDACAAWLEAAGRRLAHSLQRHAATSRGPVGELSATDLLGLALDRDALLPRIVEEAAVRVQFDLIYLVLREPEPDELELVLARRADGTRLSREERRLRTVDGGMHGWVLARGESYQLQGGEPPPTPLASYEPVGAVASLYVPLEVDGHVRGVLSLHRERGRAFGTRDVIALQALVGGIGWPVAHMHRYDSARREALKLEAVRQAALRMTASLDPSSVLDAVMDSVFALLTGVRNAHIFLYDGRALRFGSVLWRDGRRSTPWQVPRPNGITYRVARTGEAIVVHDMGQDPLFGQDDASLGWTGAIVSLPLKIGVRVVGVMNVAFEDARTLPNSDIELLRLLANQAAIAVEKAQMLHEAEQRAAALDAVRRASLSLTSSLDLDAVFDSILDATLSLMEGADDAHIFLWNGEHLSFGAARFRGESHVEPYRDPRPDGLTNRVARTGSPIAVEDMRHHPLFRDRTDWEGALVGIPLKIGDRVVGVMNVYYGSARNFQPLELRVLRLLGDQAAIGIENARLHDMTTHEAHTDALTGIPNRRAVDSRLHQEVKRALRYERGMAILMADLDGFKQFNDTYGHPVGDRVLRAVAHCLQAVTRATDYLARYGGDEFTLIMPETDLDGARQVVAKYLEALRECAFDLPDKRLPKLSISAGLAVFPEDGKTVQELLRVADARLYENKRERSAGGEPPATPAGGTAPLSR